MFNSKKHSKYSNYRHNNIEYTIPVSEQKNKTESGIKKRIIRKLSKYTPKEELLNNSENWFSKINDDQKKAIKKYKRFSWFTNCQTRKGKSKREKQIFSALNQAEIYDNIIVNRRIKRGELKYVKNAYEEFKKGQGNYFEKKDFCSTYSIPVLQPKRGNGHLLILVPKGSKAMYIENEKGCCLDIIFSIIEKEILINKGSQFQFIEDELNGNNNVFIVKLINN